MLYVPNASGALGQAALCVRYPTREAGTRSPYVPYGGPGAYVSAQHDAVVRARLDQPSERRAAACGKG